MGLGRIVDIDRFSGKTLQLWQFPKSAETKPQPAGTFFPASDGSALVLSPSPSPSFDLGAIAVTVEPEGGSALPTSPPILIAQFRR